MSKGIPVVLVIGKQHVGKTTLLKLIIPRLKKKGYRVGTIKYNIPYFEIDYEGKDTYTYYLAGADVVSISSPEKLAIIKRVNQRPPSIKDIMKHNYGDVDVVLVEGYKKWQYPYIEIYSNNRQIELTDTEHKNHLRIAVNKKTESVIPAFKKNDLKNVIKFIESKIHG